VTWTTPVGVLAIIGGWITAEAGRQPWVVYGQLLTGQRREPEPLASAWRQGLRRTSPLTGCARYRPAGSGVGRLPE
jgi:Cytochrome bd terminal oxidase subunit I